MSRIHGKHRLTGLDPNGGLASGAWLRDRGCIHFAMKGGVREVELQFHHAGACESKAHSRWMRRPLSVRVRLNGGRWKTFPLEDGGHPWLFHWVSDGVPASALSGTDAREHRIELVMGGVAVANFFAWMGRRFAKARFLPSSWIAWLQPFRRQSAQREWLLREVRVNGESLLRFTQSQHLFQQDFLLRHSLNGVNVLGWLHGYLGVGESARACARAAQAAGFEVDALSMRLPLNGAQHEGLWPAERLAKTGRHAVSIAHVDAPQSLDLLRLHPREMGRDHYRIGYWAWELPEFPDHWICHASVFHEIWCPSEFCRKAMAAKLPVPVLTMPHAIEPLRIDASLQECRRRFGLPEDAYLFLFSFDFNSYAPRKNPEGVVEAFEHAMRADPAFGRRCGLVIKAHGVGYDPAHREKLALLRARIPNLHLVDEALDRSDLTRLQMACDAFVSLHRSEGFGLGVAEMMALGKAVISTDWSATAEFLDASCGCPVPYVLKELQEAVGPYPQGQYWAEADTAAAADWMLRLSADPDLGLRLGEAAAQRMRFNFSSRAIGLRYAERLKSIALFEKVLQ
jgi:glycosyltransferase involved in cell wall biosynthesis